MVLVGMVTVSSKLDALCALDVKLKESAQNAMRRSDEAIAALSAATSGQFELPNGSCTAEVGLAEVGAMAGEATLEASVQQVIASMQLHGGAVDNATNGSATELLARRIAAETDDVGGLPPLSMTDAGRIRPGMLQDILRGSPLLLKILSTAVTSTCDLATCMSKGLGEEEEEEAFQSIVELDVFKNGIDAIAGDSIYSFGASAAKAEVSDDCCAAMQANRLVYGTSTTAVQSWDGAISEFNGDDIGGDEWKTAVGDSSLAISGSVSVASKDGLDADPKPGADMLVWWQE